MTHLRKWKFYKITEETSLPIKLWTLQRIEQISSGQIWVLHTVDVDRALCQHKWVSHLFIKGMYVWVLLKFLFCLNLDCDGWLELTGKSPYSCLVTPPVYCWAWCYVLWVIFLASWGQLAQLCSCPSSCQPPAHFLGAEWDLSPVQTLFKVAKTLVSYQHWFGHKSKTARLSVMKKNPLSQIQSQILGNSGLDFFSCF